MGTLFELLAELLIASVAVVLAHFGVSEDLTAQAAGREPPSVERTVLRTGVAASRAAAAEDCPEASGLRRA